MNSVSGNSFLPVAQAKGTGVMLDLPFSHIENEQRGEIEKKRQKQLDEFKIRQEKLKREKQQKNMTIEKPNKTKPNILVIALDVNILSSPTKSWIVKLDF